MEAFGGAKEPEEPDDRQEDDVLVGDTVAGVRGVQCAFQGGKNVKVDRVDSGAGRVLARHCCKEISEYGMVAFAAAGDVELVAGGAAANRLSGIWLTQVGDPLAHGQ